MSFVFTIKKINPLGTKDATYGQRYWAEVNEDAKPVSFNDTKDQVFSVGDVITAEESLNKRSAKGTDYLQLRKVSKGPAFAADAPASPTQAVEPKPAASVAGDIVLQLDRIERGINEILEKLEDPLSMLPDINKQHEAAE